MPDVSSTAPAQVRTWVALDVHKLSIVAATLPPSGGAPEVTRIETTERAIRRFIGRLGAPEGLAVCYEAGPGGYDLQRLLASMGGGVRHRRAVAGPGARGRSGQDRPARRQEAGPSVPCRRAGVRGPADARPG